MLKKKGDCFHHDTCCIDDGATIGEGTKIWHYAHVMAGARIGCNCIIGQGCFVGASAVIGDRVKVQNNVSIYDGVVLEDDVFVGPSVVFTNVFNPRAFVERKDEYRPTVIKRGATIGANATIVCGVHVGEYSFIGAGAVVTKDVLDFALVYGNPAFQHGWTCKCGLPITELSTFTAHCKECGALYQRDNGRMVLQSG